MLSRTSAPSAVEPLLPLDELVSDDGFSINTTLSNESATASSRVARRYASPTDGHLPTSTKWVAVACSYNHADPASDRSRLSAPDRKSTAVRYSSVTNTSGSTSATRIERSRPAVWLGPRAPAPRLKSSPTPPSPRVRPRKGGCGHPGAR